MNQVLCRPLKGTRFLLLVVFLALPCQALDCPAAFGAGLIAKPTPIVVSPVSRGWAIRRAWRRC